MPPSLFPEEGIFLVYLLISAYDVLLISTNFFHLRNSLDMYRRTGKTALFLREIFI